MDYKHEERIKLNVEIEFDLINMESNRVNFDYIMLQVIPEEIALTEKSPLMGIPEKRGGLKLKSLKVKRIINTVIKKEEDGKQGDSSR